MTYTAICGCLVLPVLAAAPAAALTEAEFQQLASEVFLPIVEEYDIPGLVVGVTVDGSHFVYTYGEADRELGIPVTGNTIFELGSVSKLFNVTLAALLEERGLLNLDRKVSDYLPELAGSAFNQITLMDLATHTTSGLPLQVPEELDSMDKLVDWLVHWRPIDVPSPMRSYSNVSIGLLGHISAAEMGTTYAEAAEETLFPLLRLTSTYVHVPPEAEARYAFGYSREDDQPIRVNPGLLADEAYGVKSTANDMLRFLEIHLGTIEVSPNLRAAVDRTQLGQTETQYYQQGMIWERYPWPVDLNRLLQGNGPNMALEPQPVQRIDVAQPSGSGAMLNKTGATNGFGAYVAMLPEEGLGVVVLANRNYPNPVRAEATYELILRILEAQGG